MSPDFSKRSDGIELMDDLNCSGPVVDQTLAELEFINKWLGGNAVTINGLKDILMTRSIDTQEPLKVADLGCGGGDMLKLLSSYFKQKKLSAHFIGIDANPNIIASAWFNSKEFLDITYQRMDILSADFNMKQYDLVFATLFFHHFTSDQLVKIFTSLRKQTVVGIVINDLHRHWLAYYSIKILTRLFSKSAMVRNDAPLSVLRGFTKNEMEEILYRAGIKNYSLKWKWAFRWQLVIQTH